MDYETVVNKMLPAAEPFLRINCDFDLDEIDEKLDWLKSKQCIEDTSVIQHYKCKCIVCHKKFFSLRKLYSHEALHPQVKKIHECNICYRVFIHKSSLLLHSKNHKKSREEVKIVKEVKKDEKLCIGPFYSYNRFNKHLEQGKCIDDTSYDAANTLLEMSEKPVDFQAKPMVEIPSEIITNLKVENTSSEIQKKKRKNAASVFICKYCGKIFDRIGHCQNHEVTHTGELPYECDFCDRKFSMRCNKKRHIDEMHIKDKKHECDKCGKKFSRNYHLKRHRKSMENANGKCYGKSSISVMPMVANQSNGTQNNHSGPCPKCENQLECSIKFGTNQIVFSYKNCTCAESSSKPSKPSNTEDHNGMVRCDLCHDRVFTSTNDLFKHEVLHFKDKWPKVHRCDKCDRKFIHLSSLKEHSKQKHSQPSQPLETSEQFKPVRFQFKCKLCEKTFRHRRQLYDHEKLSCESPVVLETNDEKPSRLSTIIPEAPRLLPKKVTTIFQQRNEIREEPSESSDFIQESNDQSRQPSKPLTIPTILSGGSYQLVEPSKPSESVGEIILAENSSVGNPSTIPTIIKAIPESKQPYLPPTTIVDLVRPDLPKELYSRYNKSDFWPCGICGKVFKKDYLRKHKTLHTESAAKCDICGKKFVHESHLKNHIRTHTGEKPYRCQDCGISFRQKGQLKRHRMGGKNRAISCQAFKNEK